MLNLPCQSTPLSSKTKSSDIYSVHRFRKQPTRGDTRRWPSDHMATCRGHPGEASHDVHTPTRLPDLFASQKFHFFASPRAASELIRSAIVAAELRRRRACKPPQKRKLRLHHSSAMSSSTFSTS